MLYWAPDLITKAIWILLTTLMFLIIYYLINIGNRFVPEDNKIKINNRTIIIGLIILIIIYTMYILFKKYDFLSDIFFTIILSIIIAYALNPVINYLEKKDKKIRWCINSISVYFRNNNYFILFSNTEIRQRAEKTHG